ncbi:Retinol dehydrogenase 5 [Haplosporangium gracile]|nr:Retinol dehydrogenase 5 [Haplosporangium gracile]
MTQNTLTDPEELVVVVTGADSGFGAAIVEDLCQRREYTIYATCLTREAVEKYQSKDSSRLRAIQVDVTNQDDVNRLRAQVEAECPQGVYCVFNNAGVYLGGFFDFSTEESFQKIMNVNYMGVVRISKALVPSLRTYARSRHAFPAAAGQQNLPRARLLTITSVGARSNTPGFGGYSASKHATASLLDTIRVELSSWEIDVSMLEPTCAKTPLAASFDTIAERNWKNADETTQRMYTPRFFDQWVMNSKLFYTQAMPLGCVVEAAVSAIVKPGGASRARVMVGPWMLLWFIWFQEKLPDWLSDHLSCFVVKQQGLWPADPFLLQEGTKEE